MSIHVPDKSTLAYLHLQYFLMHFTPYSTVYVYTSPYLYNVKIEGVCFFCVMLKVRIKKYG
jgi:hypothetical protein